MRVPVPLPRGAFSGFSVNINAQQCQNLYPVMDRYGRSVFSLRGTPGLSAWATIEADVEIRAMYPLGTTLYVVAGSNFYAVDTDGTATDKGDLDTSTGHVDISDDGSYVILSDGTSHYSYNITGDSFAKTTDSDLIGATASTQMDGYAIVSSGDQIQKSTLINPTAWAAADVTNVRVKAGDIVALRSTDTHLYILKERSYEVYYNAAISTTMPFETIGAAYNHGCASNGSAVEVVDTLYWLTDKRWVVRMAPDFRVQKVSTDAIDYQLSSLTISNARAHSYVEDGHVFYQLTFPTDSETYVYDATTDLWHTRTSYDSDSSSDKRSWANCYAYFNGNHLVGHYSDGKIYTQSLSTYADDSNRIRRVADFPHITDPEGHNKIRLNRFEIEFETGAGLITGQGSDPEAMLQVSRNFGNTWGNEDWRKIGPIGDYDAMTRWKRKGTARQLTPRVTISDPIKVVMVSANADLDRMAA